MKSLKYNEIYGNWATLLLATERDGSISYNKLRVPMGFTQTVQPVNSIPRLRMSLIKSVN
jgi:hypothetical protein